MKIKKIPRYLTLYLLTAGAALILGFLSFGGMFALWPILPLAWAAFALSVAYEGEVYLQNIQGAWNKLFKRDHLKQKLAKDYLLKHFPEDTSADDCPQFFIDYEAQLNLLDQFGHQRLDKASRARKKQAEKKLRDMEKWFAKQLFSPKDKDKDKDKDKLLTPYESELQGWLAAHEQDEQQALLESRQKKFHWVTAFSTIAAVFMSLGTTYLLVEAFSIIPLFAAIPFGGLPILIVPMALVAGAAYGFLTYNAITDMINNDTIRKWYYKLRDDFKQGITVRNVFMAVTAVLLLALAVALTICTAGTWWTVVKETAPLFTWMSKIPDFVMSIINPIIIGLSALVFNIENTSESLEMIDDATVNTKPGWFTRAVGSIQSGFQRLREQENWAQIFNPFRLLLKITMTPVRILMFFGHLISIGVISDRVPGVSQVLTAVLGIISEGFEDAHYFLHQEPEHNEGEDHKKALLQERLSAEHGHDHAEDLPTRVIKFIALPIYFLAASWDWLFSKNNVENRKTLSFQQAWEKQMGIPKEASVELAKETQQPSEDWEVEQLVYRIESFKEKHLHQVSIGADVAQEKLAALTKLQQDLRSVPTSDKAAIKARLIAEQDNPLYNKARFFTNGQTETASFVEELPDRISLCV